MSKNLLADASEPPAVIPVAVVAVDVHAALVEPVIERGTARLTVLIPPLRTVRVLVGERGVIGIDLRLCVWVGLEVPRLVFAVEVVHRDEATELEEVNFRLVSFTLGHRRDDFLVGVLRATRGVEDRLRGTHAKHLYDTDDGVALGFDVLTQHAELFTVESGVTERPLRWIRRELVSVLLEKSSEVGDGLVDLPVGHGGGRGWGHGIFHGVIPFCF